MGEYCLKTSLYLFDSNNTLDSFSILLDILFYPYECFLFYTPGGVKVPVWGKSFIILGKTIISQLHIFLVQLDLSLFTKRMSYIVIDSL